MKQPNFLFAVCISRALPQDVLGTLAGYVREESPGPLYLACSEVVVHSPFVHLTALRSDDSGKVLKIRLPTQYVLAMVDLSDEAALPIGFHS